MGSTTFILNLSLGETYRNDDIAKKRAQVKLADECDAEFDTALKANPFLPPEPPRRLPTPKITPRTKEEHEARRIAKEECEQIFSEWLEKNDDHEDKIWNDVCKAVFKRNNVSDLNLKKNGYIDYQIRNISEHDYSIFEVREL